MWGPPEYDATALALEVFANPYFYDDDVELAKKKREKREAVFGPDTTVDQVRREYMDIENGFFALASKIGPCENDRVVGYFAPAEITIEERLAGVGIVTLEASDEIKTYKERRIEGGLPSARTLLNSQLGTKGREYTLCFVLGSSGIGKTFFGVIIATVTCYHGLAQRLRLEEISAATIRAMAQSVVLCLVVDALFLIIHLIA